jgi:hypothetical protein
MEPAENFIRSCITRFAQPAAAATAVEISPQNLSCWGHYKTLYMVLSSCSALSAVNSVLRS